jgi:phage terminase small subunit
VKEPNVKPQYKLVASYYCGECAGNAEQSVIRAGYSRKYARGNAHKLVARPEVQEYITYLNSLTENDPKKHVATAVEIQGFWTEVFLNEEEDLKHRLRASELLAKAKGMFNTESW